jgi:hypothetical protein
LSSAREAEKRLRGTSLEFCIVGCEDRIWEREAEESLLLEAVARERLVKTEQAGSRYCGDLCSV